MFEAIGWHFMHVVCDVCVNVYLFIAAEIAAAVVVIVVAIAVVLLDTFFGSLPPLLLAICAQYAI